MGMEDDIGSLQPWQIFSALYLGFWVLAAYFDHFLMTFVFCLAFGVMSEIATRYMNGEHLAASSPGAAGQPKELEASLAASIVSQQLPPDNVESERLSRNSDLQEEDQPPPLPAKDYLPEADEIKEAEQMKSNLLDTAGVDLLTSSISPVTSTTTNLPDTSSLVTPSIPDTTTSTNLLISSTPETGSLVSSANIDHVNHFLDDSRFQENLDLDTARDNSESKVETIGDILDLSGSQVTGGYDQMTSDDVVSRGQGLDDLVSRSQGLVETNDGKLYAPDSSSDEELEAEYANREVNLDESESEEENGGYEFKRGISPINNDSSPEEGPNEHLSSLDDSPPLSTQDSLAAAKEPSIPAAKGAAATMSLLKETPTHSNEEVVDIDLTDPELEQAATKIQSVFKGFQARKKMGKI